MSSPSLLASLALFLLACGPSVPLADPVTCPSVALSSQNGGCDLVADQQCSDGSFYEINCGDDGTCTCFQDTTYVKSFLDGNAAAGYCASFDATKLHELSVKCGLNLNP